MGSFITTMGEDRFRNEFMAQEGIPWFVWYIDFVFRVKLYKKEFESQVDALKAGAPPKKAGLFGMFFN